MKIKLDVLIFHAGLWALAFMLGLPALIVASIVIAFLAAAL